MYLGLRGIRENLHNRGDDLVITQTPDVTAHAIGNFLLRIRKKLNATIHHACHILGVRIRKRCRSLITDDGIVALGLGKHKLTHLGYTPVIAQIV